MQRNEEENEWDVEEDAQLQNDPALQRAMGESRRNVGRRGQGGAPSFRIFMPYTDSNDVLLVTEGLPMGVATLLTNGASQELVSQITTSFVTLSGAAVPASMWVSTKRKNLKSSNEFDRFTEWMAYVISGKRYTPKKITRDDLQTMMPYLSRGNREQHVGMIRNLGIDPQLDKHWTGPAFPDWHDTVFPDGAFHRMMEEATSAARLSTTTTTRAETNQTSNFRAARGQGQESYLGRRMSGSLFGGPSNRLALPPSTTETSTALTVITEEAPLTESQASEPSPEDEEGSPPGQRQVSTASGKKKRRLDVTKEHYQVELQSIERITYNPRTGERDHARYKDMTEELRTRYKVKEPSKPKTNARTCRYFLQGICTRRQVRIFP